MNLEFLEWGALIVDLVGVMIMLLGFVIAVGRFVPTLRKPAESIMEVQKIRCLLGIYLVFALELMIVSDLLHSVIERDLEDLYFLGAIVALRTLIAYFLGKDIQEMHPAQ